MAHLSEFDRQLIANYCKRTVNPSPINQLVSRRIAVERLPRTRVLIMSLIVLFGAVNWLSHGQSDAMIGQTTSSFIAQRAQAPDEATIKLTKRPAVKSTTTKTVSQPAPSDLGINSLPADNEVNGSGPSSAQQYDSYGYSFGQCTYYVSSRRPIPNNWGNARDWLPRARALGWLTGPNPSVGAIAWTPSGPWGHVAYVEKVDGERVLVSEMNYAGWNLKSYRWAASASFQYIY